MLAIHAGAWWFARGTISQGGLDFTIFYSAGKMLNSGMGSQIYDEAAEWHVQQEVVRGTSRKAAIPFMHAPFEALLFVPFSVFSYVTAYVLWNLGSLILLVLLPFVVRPHLPALAQFSPALITLLCLGSFPVFLGMLEGQDTILLLFLYCLVFAAFKENAWVTAGALLALSLFRFHLVLPLVLVMLFLKIWRVLGGFVLAGIGLAMISAAFLGWKVVLHYPFYIWSLEQHRGGLILPPRDYPDLRGLIESWFSNWAGAQVLLAATVVVSAAALYVVFWQWKRIREPSPQRFDLVFALAVLVTLLVGYHTLLYDYSLLIIPALIVLNYVLENPQLNQWQRVVLLSPMVLLFFTPLYVFLWMHRWEGSNLMALLLVGWAWALSATLSRRPQAGELTPVHAVHCGTVAKGWPLLK
ncbi:MAG: glycosyltransferase 87 family protein [Terriglobales bacterium]